MKQLLRLIISFILFSGCKCKLAKSPTSKAYRSIKDSKENNAFVSEVQPESSSIRIGGHDYVIREAWVEHPHLERGYSDSLINQAFALVVNFNDNPNDTLELPHFVAAKAHGYHGIWVYLPQAHMTDTFKIRYWETLDSAKKNKTFLFFKKQ